MTESERCPDQNQLRDLIAGALTVPHQEELSRHIDHCPKCQQTLETLAGTSWQEQARRLGEEKRQGETALQHVMQEALARDASENASDAETPETLEFLQPSDNPKHLGRLGHYDIMEVVGRGAMGTVLKAFDNKLHRIAAIKIMSAELAANATARQRFVREARAAAAVTHENVVTIHAVDEEHRPPYLAMQYVDGVSLQEKLDEQGQLGIKETLRIGMQIAEGLAAAHKQGLVHRDIKPSNILLENGVERVKITDFGLARAVDDARVTQSGVISGTPLYMSPEQADGLSIDHRSDLFSLGTVLYVMCTGRPPFRAGGTMGVLKRVCEDTPRPIREINPDAPEYLVELISKLHEKNPNDRYQSAGEVAELLNHYLAVVQRAHEVEPAIPVSQKRSHPIESVPTKKRRKSTPVWVIALVCILCCCTGVPVMGVLVYFFSHSTDVIQPNAPLQRDNNGNGGEKKVLQPANVTKPAPREEWLQLFNGEDLKGWKTHPDAAGAWSVANGILKGSTSKGYLFTERSDFQNFHLRVEGKINAGGDGSILFRAPYEVLKVGAKLDSFGVPNSYFTVIHQCVRLRNRPTGSIARSGPPGAGYPPALAIVQDDSLIRPGELFTLELIAEGNHLVTRINGEAAASCTDPISAYKQGHIALNLFTDQTVIEFRKIEIKELPPSPSEEDWLQLFNRKDLTGWRTHPDQPGDWKVENGLLVGRNGPTHLFTERDDFENFHLRAEVKINDKGNSGIFFRSSFGIDGFNRKTPLGYEAQINSTGDQFKTGSLFRLTKNKVFFLRLVKDMPVNPDEWFVMDLIANGNSLSFAVDGKLLAIAMDENFQKGHLALQVFDAITEVHFKKIEIRNLSSP